MLFVWISYLVNFVLLPYIAIHCKDIVVGYRIKSSDECQVITQRGVHPNNE